MVVANLGVTSPITAGKETPETKAGEQVKDGYVKVKQQVESVFGCLGSTHRGARDVAAQVVAATATIELPKGQWLEVIEALVKNVTSTASNELKQSSLKVLGYICEEIDPDVLESQSNLILTAVIQGMRKEETDPDTRLAGTQALYNALAFVKKNFDNETERNYIMQTVCEGTQAERKDRKSVV